MTITVHNDLEQGSEAWLAARRGIVTASVIGQLITPSTLKVANNDTSRALTLTLAAERINGWTDDVYVTSDMWRGTTDEPIARDYYSQHVAPVTEVGFMTRNDHGVTIGCSPDGLVGDDGLIEIKSRRPKKHLQTIVHAAVPVENQAQIQAGLWVSGRAWCDYVSWCGGMRPFIVRVTPDPQWQDAIVAAVQRFEEAVEHITRTYYDRVGSMPETERVTEQEMTL